MEKKQELKVELSPEIATGQYSNLAILSHSPQEFFLDFVTMTPSMPQAKVVSRIIMTPENAKNLYFALRDNIAKYENNFGEIRPKQLKNGNPAGELPNPFQA